MEVPAINLKKVGTCPTCDSSYETSKIHLIIFEFMAIVLVHWLLTVWGCMIGLSISYAWGNFSVLAVGVWAIAQRDSIDAVLLFLMGMMLTILTDIIQFSIFYAIVDFQGALRFTAGMAILNLLLKPVSCFFVYQMYRERGGDYNVNFDIETSVDSRCTMDSADGAFVGRRY